MIKVIHIIADLNYGGAGQYLFNILKYTNYEKYEIQVICHGKGQLYEKLIRETNIKVHLVSPTTKAKSFSVEILKGIYSILKTEKPDLVHVHASLAGRIAGKILGMKIILTKHWRQNKGRRLINKITANLLTDKIIAISQSVATSLVEAGIGEKKIALIHNGIDIKHYEEAILKNYKKIWNLEDEKIIGIVGRLELEKDHETFLQAAKILCEKRKDVHFIIVGHGSRRQELEDYSVELGINNKLTFTGFISDVREAISTFDISVLTSTNEAFGLVLAESMILEKPILATNLDGIYEVVKDGGRFFKAKDYNALANHIEDLLDDSVTREKLGEIGKKRVRDMFDARKMVAKLENLYKEVLEN